MLAKICFESNVHLISISWQESLVGEMRNLEDADVKTISSHLTYCFSGFMSKWVIKAEKNYIYLRNTTIMLIRDD